MRGLNRDKFIHVGRFSSSENFVCEREEFVIYAFINFQPV